MKKSKEILEYVLVIFFWMATFLWLYRMWHRAYRDRYYAGNDSNHLSDQDQHGRRRRRRRNGDGNVGNVGNVGDDDDDTIGSRSITSSNDNFGSLEVRRRYEMEFIEQTLTSYLEAAVAARSRDPNHSLTASLFVSNSNNFTDLLRSVQIQQRKEYIEQMLLCKRVILGAEKTITIQLESTKDSSAPSLAPDTCSKSDNSCVNNSNHDEKQELVICQPKKVVTLYHETSIQDDVENCIDQQHASGITNNKELVIVRVDDENESTAKDDADNNNDDSSDMQGACPICLSDYEDGDEIAWSRNRDCVHVFHKACISEWLLSHGECPYCRCPFLSHSGFAVIDDDDDNNNNNRNLRSNTSNDPATRNHDNTHNDSDSNVGQEFESRENGIILPSAPPVVTVGDSSSSYINNAVYGRRLHLLYTLATAVAAAAVASVPQPSTPTASATVLEETSIDAGTSSREV